MRRLISGNAAPTGDDRAANENSATQEGETHREQEFRYQRDDREEKTAEVNAEDELFGSGHFSLDENTWEGLEAAYNLHLQLAAGTNGLPCPICLRVTQLPVRQDCGHVLCLQCMQQSASAIGGCPLCQTQQFFKVGKNAAPETEMRMMGFAYTATEQDIGNPVNIGTPSGFPSSHSGLFLQADQIQHYGNCSSNSTSVSIGYDDRENHDLLPNSSDGPLQLDNLSDLDDVIDLADLVSSDCERPSPPVAARTSRGGSFVAGPARRPRTLVRKKTAEPKLQSIEPTTTNTAATSTVGRAGKRKARSRRSKQDELQSVHMQWENVATQGGIVDNLRLNDLHVLDLDESSPRWIQPPISGTPPPPGSLLQIFVVGDVLYAIGGTIDGKFLTNLHAINLKSDQWTWETIEVAGMLPSMRYWYSIAVMKEMAVLYGGYGHPNRLNDSYALRFDTETPTWVKLQPRGDNPGLSSTHSVCVVKDQMYMFGGYDGKFRRGQLYAFEVEGVFNESIECVWRKVETQGCGPAARYTHCGASIGSQIIVYGGNSGCLKGDAYVLDLGTEIPTWKLAKCEPMLTPRAWHRAVVRSDAMYVFGGRTANGNDNNLVRIALSREIGVNPAA